MKINFKTIFYFSVLLVGYYLSTKISDLKFLFLLQVTISKRNIGLVSDDICSLPEKIAKRYQIEIVKTKLYFPEWERFPEKNLYQVMRETKAHPKTSAPSPGDYLKAYKRTLGKFKKILVVTLSSKLSATYNSAFQAKTLMPDPSKIEIVDSLSAVAPEGLLVLKAAELIKHRENIGKIIKTLKSFREKIKFFGFLETTYWVEKIGRMTTWQGKVFQFLKGIGIQPMLGLKKGKVTLTGFNFLGRTPFEAVFHQLEYQAKKTQRKGQTFKVGINYTDNIDFAFKLKDKIEKELGAKVMFVSQVPPIVGANSGPGTLIAACYKI